MKITFMVGEEEVTFDEQEFEIQEPMSERPVVAARLAYWGRLHAEAEAICMIEEASYRNWKAEQLAARLAADPKEAEWKCSAQVEANPDFVTMKARMAEAERVKILCKSAFDSTRTKASMLEAALRRDADERAFAGSIGFSQESDALPTDEELSQKGKEVFKNKGAPVRRKAS